MTENKTGGKDTFLHETSIAVSVLDQLESLLRQKGAQRVLKIVLTVGELRMVDEVSLTFALQTLSKHTPVEGMEVNMEREDAGFRCASCGSEWGLHKEEVDDDQRVAMHLYPDQFHGFFQCPECGSKEFEVMRGRDLRLKSVTLEFG